MKIKAKKSNDSIIWISFLEGDERGVKASDTEKVNQNKKSHPAVISPEPFPLNVLHITDIMA